MYPPHKVDIKFTPVLKLSFKLLTGLLPTPGRARLLIIKQNTQKGLQVLFLDNDPSSNNGYKTL